MPLPGYYGDERDKTKKPDIVSEPKSNFVLPAPIPSIIQIMEEALRINTERQQQEIIRRLQIESAIQNLPAPPHQGLRKMISVMIPNAPLTSPSPEAFRVEVVSIEHSGKLVWVVSKSVYK